MEEALDLSLSFYRLRMMMNVGDTIEQRALFSALKWLQIAFKFIIHCCHHPVQQPDLEIRKQTRLCYQDIFRNLFTIGFIIIISNLSNDRSKASSKTIPPHSAI